MYENMSKYAPVDPSYRIAILKYIWVITNIYAFKCMLSAEPFDISTIHRNVIMEVFCYGCVCDISSYSWLIFLFVRNFVYLWCMFC